jgi:hypothetical protein
MKGSVAIVGCGRGWAVVFARAGYLEQLDPQFVDEAGQPPVCEGAHTIPGVASGVCS